jgi:hypothetical protein
MGPELALRLPREGPTLRWEEATPDNWFAISPSLQFVGLSGVVVRLNTFTRMTPARGLVFTSPRGRSLALASSSRTTISVHAALTRSKNGPTVSVSVVPTVSSKIIPSLILRMAASSSSAHRAVSSRTTRLLYKTWVLSSDRKAYMADVFFPGNVSRWYQHGGL